MHKILNVTVFKIFMCSCLINSLTQQRTVSVHEKRACDCKLQSLKPIGGQQTKWVTQSCPSLAVVGFHLCTLHVPFSTTNHCFETRSGHRSGKGSGSRSDRFNRSNRMVEPIKVFLYL